MKNNKFFVLVFLLSALVVLWFTFHRATPVVTAPEPVKQTVEAIPVPTPANDNGITVGTVDNMLVLVNEERQKAGVPILKSKTTLNWTAAIKACDMDHKNYFAHNDLDGAPSWGLFTRSGYYYEKAGENLAQGFDSDTKMMEAFMNSPTHRDNILDPKFLDLGIGRCGRFLVQHFGREK